MKDTRPLIVAVLVTALVVGAGMYLLLVQRTTKFEQQVKSLESANAELRQQVTALQEQIKAKPKEEGGTRVEITRQPRPGWQAYFPTAETTTLTGKSVDEVRSLLGEPPVLLRSIARNPEFNREIWVFMPFEEDPTGLYIFFKGDRVSGSRLDEFNGIVNSGLLDDADFWQS
ncbi:MAG: hypothetical protein ACOZCF_07945 [Bacillota bacterium]